MKGKKASNERPVIEDPAINRRITLLRHSLNLTQIEFAKKILISNGFIAGIELGKRKINDRLLRLIKITFGVNENWLRTGEGSMFEKDKTPDYKISDVLETFKKLSPSLQDLILEHLHKLLEYEKTIKK
ncbi:MAG: helix-turn-helix domain-containing protein [Treponema sp.]|jgi:transcriptional regulator with XRE-family HTH domain|nr:helix-turn-helix domain-containing protein [Treponema sp.]